MPSKIPSNPALCHPSESIGDGQQEDARLGAGRSPLRRLEFFVLVLVLVLVHRIEPIEDEDDFCLRPGRAALVRNFPVTFLKPSPSFSIRGWTLMDIDGH